MASQDNLQEIADEVRADLRKGFGGLWVIRDQRLPEPLRLEVTPDGISWLVHVTCGERVLYDATGATCVKPEEFLEKLYVFLRECMKAAMTPKVKPS